MGRQILAALLAALSLLWLPAEPAERTAAPEKPAEQTAAAAPAEPQSWDAVETVRLDTGDGILTLTMGEYLTAVVLSEMPPTFEPAALMAQAVAARTYACKHRGGKHTDCDLCGDSDCCQAWQSEAALEARYGEQYETYAARAAAAVAATDGQVLTYDGALIDATFFSCSGGRTEAAAAVWGGDVPYLRSVESPGEEDSPRYLQETAIPLADFQAALPEVKRWEKNPAAWFGGETRTEGGGVAKLEICGFSYSGTELRRRLSLPSTDFTVAVTADAVVFETHGYGHRVGMSQYGANAMAKNGATAAEILAHYYPGTQ